MRLRLNIIQNIMLIITLLATTVLAGDLVVEEKILDENPLIKAIETEITDIKNLKEELRNMTRFSASICTELDSYKLQNNVFSGFLFSPTFSFNELEKAVHISRQTVENIEKNLYKCKSKNEELREKLSITTKQFDLILSQIENMKAISFLENENKKLLSIANKLKNLLLEKQNMINEFINQYSELISKLVDVKCLIETTLEQLESRNKFNEKKIDFKKKISEYSSLNSLFLKAILKIKVLISSNFWSKEIENLLNSGLWAIIKSILLLIFIISFAFLFNKKCILYISSRKEIKDLEWNTKIVTVFSRSIFLSAFLILLYSLNIFNVGIYRPFYVYSLVKLMIIYQVILWIINFIKLEFKLLPYRVVLISFLKEILFFCSIYTIANLVFLDSLIIIFIVRLTGQFFFLFRILNLFKNVKVTYKRGLLLIKNSIVIVIIIGILIDLNGYAVLSVYWYFNWFKILAIGFWSYLVLMAYMELVNLVLNRQKILTNTTTLFLRRWFSTKNYILLLLWVTASLSVVLIVCFGFESIINLILLILSFKFAIGGIILSFSQIIFSVLILLLTKVIIELSKSLFDRKISNNIISDQGLKNSIITINVYFLWGIGLLISLSLLGVSATSMAVAFGALGIGLGFGLQSIFNNFISGIILLFERPIQVGDYVEVGGIWGKVKKINVRATIVQSFDNASLIIPNSEFVNSQVTNWSFKDNRVRRTIKIGVAYGSDIKKVQFLLIDIADQTKNVLKKPEASVLFSDYGDSVLLFSLRYWTVVEYGFNTETKIRCKIDQVFREHNIKISFPQRDIHIRNIPPILLNK